MSDSAFEIIKLVLSGAFGGALGGLVVAWSNWGIEKRRQKLNYQRELIAAWRKMISSTQSVYRKRQSTDDQDAAFAELLEASSDYFSLKPHLTQSAIDALKNEKYDKTINIVMAGRKALINPPDAIVAMLVDEVARIEAEWDLV
jgi:hypothetical protein